MYDETVMSYKTPRFLPIGCFRDVRLLFETSFIDKIETSLERESVEIMIYSKYF